MTLEIPDLSDLDLAFPARALDWMPAPEEIPPEFRYGGESHWLRLAASWFSNGLPEQAVFYPRDGVDPEKAVRAVQATLGSYAPTHQHKLEAAAFMLASWFEKVEHWK